MLKFVIPQSNNVSCRYAYFQHSNGFFPGRPELGFIAVFDFPGESIELKGSITSGYKDAFNNRQCLHNEAYGTLFPYDTSQYMTYYTRSGLDGQTPFSYDLHSVTNHRDRKLIATDLSYGMPRPFHYTFPNWVTGGWNLSNLSASLEYYGPKTYKFKSTYTVVKNGPIIENVTYIELDDVLFMQRSSSNYPVTGTWYPMHTSKTLSYRSLDLLPEPSQFYRDMNSFTVSLRKHSSNRIFGDLVRRATDDASFTSINSIEFLKDVPEVFNEISSAAPLLIRSNKINLKDVASLFLSVKYGTKLTVADSKKYFEDSQRQMRRAVRKTLSARAREEIDEKQGSLFLRSVYNIKIYYKAHDEIVNKTMNSLLSCGLFPSPGNVWAIVPYSFVVDWAVPISSYLDAYDSKTFWGTCNVLNELYSDKLIINNITSLNCGVIEGWMGSIGYKKYSRLTSSSLTHQPVYCDTKSGGFSNYASATALILQRRD